MFLPRFISPFRSPQKYSYMEAEEISHEKSDTRKEQIISGMKNLRTRERAEMLPQISRRRIFEEWRDDGGGVFSTTPPPMSNIGCLASMVMLSKIGDHFF